MPLLRLLTVMIAHDVSVRGHLPLARRPNEVNRLSTRTIRGTPQARASLVKKSGSLHF